MATVDQRSIVDKIIAGNGIYDPEDTIPCVKIVEYQNIFDGRKAWGLIFAGEDLDRYRETDFVREPRTIWELELR